MNQAGFEFWRLLAGIGLFLFAMAQLESALQSLGGRSFKSFLRRFTDRPLKAVFAGTVLTAMVQSSSLVGLMVLAFVGAGVMSLANALGVIFGANLGTTFTGWLVALLGFRLEIQALSLPLIGIGSLVLIGARGRLSESGRLVAALGLLLLGLDFMKESVAALQETVDPSDLAGFAAWQYLLFGMVFAAVIQSSSATMMVALAALDGGIIGLPAAAAVAIGADLGTTTTVLLGSLKGTAPKKRAAVAHFIFNLVTDAIAFAGLIPLLALVALTGLTDPLLSLVAFHSLFNFIGIVLFLPFSGRFAAWLGGLFAAPATRFARHLGEVDPNISEAALLAVEAETAHLLLRVLEQNRRAFDPPLPLPLGYPPVAVPSSAPALPADGDFGGWYRGTKRLEGEILTFATGMQAQPLDRGESVRLTQLLAAIRHAVHAAKQLKDIHHNLEEFRDATEPEVNAFLQHVVSVMSEFYAALYRLRRGSDEAPTSDDLAALLGRAHDWHDRLHHEIFDDLRGRRVDDAQVSSLLNVNRELLNCNLSILMALASYYLEPAVAEELGRSPANA